MDPDAQSWSFQKYDYSVLCYCGMASTVCYYSLRVSVCSVLGFFRLDRMCMCGVLFVHGKMVELSNSRILRESKSPALASGP